MAAAVDRETRAEAEEGLDSIKSSEARALLLLQQQSDDLTRHLHAIQRVADEVAAATSAAESPLRFLERFRALADACDRLSAKPFREEIEARQTRSWRPASPACLASGWWPVTRV